MSSADKTKLDGVASGAEVNVNADWNAASGDAQILNKPVLHGLGPSFTSINWQAGAHWAGTLSFNTIIAFQDVVVGKTITVEITGYAQFGVNWPSGITWLSGSAPSITDGATTYFRILATSGSTFLGEAFNPMTAQDKTKLNGIATGAEVNVNADWTASSGDAQILNKPSNVTTSVDGFMSATDKTKLNGIATGAEVNVNADWNATTGDAQILNKPSNVTTSVDGFMSATDKTKLNGIATGAEVNVNADWTASSGDAVILNKPATFPPTLTGLPVELVVACSDETNNLTVGANKVTFRAPFAFTLTAVRASVNTAPTGSTLVVDINENGTSVLSTKLSIDANEKTSTTAASAAVISDSAIANDVEITIDIDQVGSTIAGKGLKIVLIGTRA
jgi:Cu/Ag efflux protein CusF